VSDHDPIRVLSGLLARLPGVGERTARRLVFHLLREDRELMKALAVALTDAAEQVHECPRCCAITAAEGDCDVCCDAKRDERLLCVVASIQDQAAIEATGEFRGRYHILHGTLAPLEGKGPDDLRIAQLIRRLGDTDSAVNEIILATPPTVDGEATALYLARQLGPAGLTVSRIASGVPVGGELQFADKPTLARALTLRRPVG
jgi:recombination protein RecR